jgi:simple sugar transport system ATP-binding protein
MYPTTTNQTKNSAVEFKEVTKTFGSVVANHKISFSVPQGSIEALVGENGAGKSTAMKILFGLYKEDSGEILVKGKPQHWRSPRDAIKNGIGMVHQHFMLAETATGLDNILLGDEEETLKFPFVPVSLNFIDRKKAKERIECIAKNYGIDVPLDVKVSKLSVGMQQRIEILKILYRNANILILDEPTAVLTPIEVEELFKNLKKLKDEGKTIIIVTHKLKEVLNFTDHITVFRSGRIVGEMQTADATEEKIARMMVGKNINLHPHIEQGKNLKPLELNLKDLTLHKGEIVGIAGVEGNGQSELIDLVYNTALSQGDYAVGLIPEDRQFDGLLMNMSAVENYLLGRQWDKSFRFGFFQNTQKIKETVESEMKKYDVRPKNPDLLASQFSGGNQQKIIIAREFGKNPSLIIAANPTRGVDIGAIEFIHDQILKSRDSGAAILLISSELDEITKLSDRILVMYNGKIVAQYTRGQADDHTIGLAMCGGLK